MTTLYGTTVADTTLASASRMASATGGTSTSKQTVMPSGTGRFYAEVWSRGNASLPSSLVFSTLPTPQGNGWVFTPGAGTFGAGSWSGTFNVAFATLPFTGSHLTLRFSKYSGGSYTVIGSIQSANITSAAQTAYTFAATSMSAVTFGPADELYVDLFLYDPNGPGTDNPSVYESSTSLGVALFAQVTTSTFTTAPPALATTPTSLSFSGTVGGASPSSQNDTLSETNGVGTAWTSSISYTSGSGWLALSPTSGTLAASGTAPISVSVTTGALALGTYTATITFTATTGGATAALSVAFTVAAPQVPQGSVNPTALFFTAHAGGLNPSPSNVLYSNTGNGSGSWSRSVSYGSGGSGWLTLSPTSGTLAPGANVLITFTAATGALPVGTYTATAQLTIGASAATVTVTFVITPAPPTNFLVTLAGQDITSHADQLSIKIHDTLGQGPGAGSSGATQGRAATVEFNTDLGPMSAAIGAGQKIPNGPAPVLVRQGEIIITDASGSVIFGGYATKYTDSSTQVIGQTKQNFTRVSGIDYSTSLQRTIVNETFSGQTDIQILAFVLKKYAPWVSLQYLPTRPAYTFPISQLRNITVEQVIQTIGGITGYLAYVDYQKNFRYVAPTVASSAPFNLSWNPDFLSTFPHGVTDFTQDDNAAINRVFFFGGTKPSNNFWQDVSPLANGNNTVFTLAYSPIVTTDGKYHVKLNGTEVVVGTANGTTTSNQFKSAGGLADVLIDQSSRSMTFDVAPATGTQVLVQYRYNFPLSLVLTDEVSHTFFGSPYLDGSIDDSTIFDLPTAVQRCKVLLSQQNYGLVTLKLDIWKAGVQAGMLIGVNNQLRGINGTYLVQEVEIEPLGGGNFVYHLTLGAWNWNLIDFLLKIPTLATFQDDQTNESQEVVTVEQLTVKAGLHDTWGTRTSSSPYYARASALGDGHDAYPGFSTISS